MRLRVCAPTMPLLAFLSFVPPAIAQNTAAPDRFVGTWKEDESKRQMGSEAPLVFRPGANGQIEEARGGGSNPQYQPVVFDGKPRPTTTPDRTIVWKQLDANTFERTLSEGAKLLTTRNLQIAGRTLTETTIIRLADGSTRRVIRTYERAQPNGKGLVGWWNPKTLKSDTPDVSRFERVGSGLREIGAAGDTATLTFDGKPAPVTGGAVIRGTAMNARLVDDRTIEIVTTRDGARVGHSTYQLSADGKTLTTSFVAEGPGTSGKPTVSVYIKQ